MPVLSIGAILVPILGPEAAKIIKTKDKNTSLSLNFILLILILLKRFFLTFIFVEENFSLFSFFIKLNKIAIKTKK